MGKPILILVNGIPGTGKTTISRKLAKGLDLPCVGKDDIKEFLFDHIETDTIERAKDVGAVSFEMLYAFIQTSLSRGLSIIVECPFYYEFGHGRIAQIVASATAICIEVYCDSDPTIRRQRFRDRQGTPGRHPGHFDQHHINSQETDEEVAAKYAPLAVGPVIRLDTTEFTDEAYKRMLKEVRDAIQYEGDTAKGTKGATHA